MKKFIYIVVGIMIILGALVIFLERNEQKVKISTEKEVTTQLDRGNTFLLVIGVSTCSHCNDYKAGTLLQYQKNPTVPLYFVYSDISFANKTDFSNFIQKYNINYSASPTTYLVKNGYIIKSVEGNINLTELNNLIKNNI